MTMPRNLMELLEEVPVIPAYPEILSKMLEAQQRLQRVADEVKELKTWARKSYDPARRKVDLAEISMSLGQVKDSDGWDWVAAYGMPDINSGLSDCLVELFNMLGNLRDSISECPTD